MALSDDKVIPYLVVKDKNCVNIEDVEKAEKITLARGHKSIYPVIAKENIGYDIYNFTEIGGLIYFWYLKAYKPVAVLYNKSTKKHVKRIIL